MQADRLVLDLLIREGRIMFPDIMLSYGPPERPRKTLLEPAWTAVLEEAALAESGGAPYVQARAGGAEYLITASGSRAGAARIMDAAAERDASALLIDLPPEWEDPSPERVLGLLLYTREHKRWLRSSLSVAARQQMLDAAERIPLRRRGRFARFICAPRCPRKGRSASGKDLSVDLKCMAGCPDLVFLDGSAVWCGAGDAGGREDLPAGPWGAA